MDNFNWQTEFIGKKVINEKGEVGTFINNDNKTFTVNYDNGQGLNAEIGSPLSLGWKLVEIKKEEYNGN